TLTFDNCSFVEEVKLSMIILSVLLFIDSLVPTVSFFKKEFSETLLVVHNKNDNSLSISLNLSIQILTDFQKSIDKLDNFSFSFLCFKDSRILSLFSFEISISSNASIFISLLSSSSKAFSSANRIW